MYRLPFYVIEKINEHKFGNIFELLDQPAPTQNVRSLCLFSVIV